MTETAGSPAWIDEQIRATGLAIIGVSGAIPCADCGEVHDEADDAFVYTVGRAERGEPELLSLLILPEEVQQVAALHRFLNQRATEGHPVTDGQIIQDNDPETGAPIYWMTIGYDAEAAAELNESYLVKARERAGRDVPVLLVERRDRLAAVEERTTH
jgi:hypothetical protein